MREIDTGETIGIKRKLDNLGRIVLPIEFRKYLNLKIGDEVEILLLKDGIFIRKEI